MPSVNVTVQYGTGPTVCTDALPTDAHILLKAVLPLLFEVPYDYSII